MLLSLGVNYKRAPLATLDALVLRDPLGFFQILTKIPGVKSPLILQTCNRVEIYLETEDRPDLAEKVLCQWALETKFKLGELSQLAEKKQGDAVVEHLVRLGSGLESMLVGESQILGQMKNALADARSLKPAGTDLWEVFEKAISAASKIREETGIGKGTVSLGSAAIRLAEETLGKVDNLQVILVGTGQVGMLVMKALKARAVTNVFVAGRTRQRTESFCRTYGGRPIGLHDIPGQLPSADLVIVATRSSSYLLTKNSLIPTTKRARPSRLMLLDLSSPRNISPDVKEISGLILKTMEDLRGIADEALSRRREIVKASEPLVKQKVESILSLLRRQNAEPIVSDLYRRADEIRSEELGKALSKLKLTSDQQQVLENMSLSLVEKLLGPPVESLRKAAEKGDSETLTIAGQIFGGD